MSIAILFLFLFFLDPQLTFNYNDEKMIASTIRKELIKRLGKGKVFTEKEYLLTYAYDATGIEAMPDVVVLPENEGDIKSALEVSNRFKIPVTPRGAGVGYSGGALPVRSGMVLAFTRMNRILKIDTANLTAEVEPGVVTHQLQQECEKSGLFYPPDPASLKTSTIGGNVAENAGGMRCFKYGVTGNYVLSLTGFLVNGTRFRAGSPCIKDVAGYNIKSLLIGSEGTLAVISKVVLKLLPLPEARILFRVDFKSLKQGATFIERMIMSRINPSVLEFMDRSSISASYRYMGLKEDREIGGAVLVEIDGRAADVKERARGFEDLVRSSDTLRFESAQTRDEQERLWKIRRSISPAISRIKPKKINEDIVVPVSRIPETVQLINDLSGKYDLSIILFGHFGDGNIHTNIMVDPEDKGEMDRASRILEEIFEYVVSVEGSITGEHGVGIAKKPFMKYQFNDQEIDIFRKIKRVFDPENLLNPGKIF